MLQKGRKRLKRTYPSASEGDDEEAKPLSAMKSAGHRPATRASTRVQTLAGRARSQQKCAHEESRKAGSQKGDGLDARAMREPRRQLRSRAARSPSPAATSEVFIEEESHLSESSPPRAVRRSRRGGQQSEAASQQPAASHPSTVRRSKRGGKRGGHPAADQEPNSKVCTELHQLSPPRTVRRSSKSAARKGTAAAAQDISEEGSEQPEESSPPRTVRRSSRRRRSSRLVQRAAGISSDDEEVSGENTECQDPSICKRPTQRYNALLMYLCCRRDMKRCDWTGGLSRFLPMQT